MRVGFLAVLCCVILLSANAQDTARDESLMGITGRISALRQAQDDISFYTWSLYITVDLGASWLIYQDSMEINIDTADIHKGCNDMSLEKIRFNKNCFYNEKVIKEFLGGAHEGSKVKVYAKKSSLIKFFSGGSCQVRMEAIRKIKY